MKELYQNLCDAADEKDYPDVPVVDTSNTKSFNKVFVRHQRPCAQRSGQGA
jgi:hypothetical protein